MCEIRKECRHSDLLVGGAPQFDSYCCHSRTSGTPGPVAPRVEGMALNDREHPGSRELPVLRRRRLVVPPLDARLRGHDRGGAEATTRNKCFVAASGSILCHFSCRGRKGGNNSLRARKNSLRRRAGNFLAGYWSHRDFRDGFRGKAAESAIFPAFFPATRELSTRPNRRSWNVGLN